MMMRLLVALEILILIISAETGPSMHNPHFCYTTDPIRSVATMNGIATSYEAVRRLNITTVSPYESSRSDDEFW